jgi:hypothetical protein
LAGFVVRHVHQGGLHDDRPALDSPHSVEQPVQVVPRPMVHGNRPEA